MNEKTISVRGARFPGRYIQGQGVMARLGTEVAAFAARAVVVLDGGVFAILQGAIAAALDGKVKAELVRHGGECSDAEIARIVGLGRAAGAGAIVGIGGGKALDTAKAAAHGLGVPAIIVPTIASSDAPCSALAVVYNEDGGVAYDKFLPRNPDLVLVDTAIISQAPSRFLIAGIGDALATYYEADSCRDSGAFNCLGMPGLEVAHAIARACRDTIFAFGAAAVAECDAKTAGPALERVVEANILLSGIGFESGGVASAHGIHHGLCELPDVHHHLHGEKVAIGVLAGLKLRGKEDEFQRVLAFCQSVRLPTRLADIGITEVTPEKLRIVAERACRPGEITHNEPLAVTSAMLVDALRALPV
ncbi:glycerol dehydrogenase [Janthinobacterium sp. Mn2066]|uniref:glycerol dehydrogenase n=1 Tax=Janthinobacterium sp. Mn2066 TaxID=3395264 RepID=UPI003BCA4C64